MHTLLLLSSFLIIYSMLKWEYHKIGISQSLQHRTGHVCYILCSAVLFMFAGTLNFWVMNATGCVAFHSQSWDMWFSLFLGGAVWLLFAMGIVRAFLAQRKVSKVIGLVAPCSDTGLNLMVERLSAVLNISSPRISVYSSDSPYAATLRCTEPIILLSSWMLENLDNEQLEAVIAHELAHIHRKDTLRVSVYGVLKGILFFLPTVQQVWQNFLADLETAADDMAVLITKKPTALASAIVRVYQEQPKQRFAYGVSYFTPDFNHIEARVERLLTGHVNQMAELPNCAVRLFDRDILYSIGLMVVFLVGVFLMPYGHWITHSEDHMFPWCISHFFALFNGA